MRAPLSSSSTTTSRCCRRRASSPRSRRRRPRTILRRPRRLLRAGARSDRRARLRDVVAHSALDSVRCLLRALEQLQVALVDAAACVLRELDRLLARDDRDRVVGAGVTAHEVAEQPAKRVADGDSFQDVEIFEVGDLIKTVHRVDDRAARDWNVEIWHDGKADPRIVVVECQIMRPVFLGAALRPTSSVRSAVAAIVRRFNP